MESIVSRRWRKVGVAICLIIGMGMVVPVEGASPEGSPTGKETATRSGFKPVLKRAEEMIGYPVHGPGGAYLGLVGDLVLDTRDNRVSHIVLNPAGMVDLGVYSNVIPWENLHLTADGKGFLAVPVVERPWSGPFKTGVPQQYNPPGVNQPPMNNTNPMEVQPGEGYQELNDNDRDPYGRLRETVDYGDDDSPQPGEYGWTFRDWYETHPNSPERFLPYGYNRGTFYPGEYSRYLPYQPQYNQQPQTQAQPLNLFAGENYRPYRTNTPWTPYQQGGPSSAGDRFWRDLNSKEGPTTVRHIRLTTLVGMDVVDLSRDSFGNVEDAVVDMHEGRLVFVVLSFGGVPGMDNKITIVPWRELRIRTDLGVTQVDVPEKKLEEDQYDINSFPDLANLTKAAAIYERFGMRPYWEVYGYISPRESSRIRMTAWQPGSEYNKLFNPDTLTTIHGMVSGVGTFKPTKSAESGTRLRVYGDDGKTHLVFAGPRSYISKEGVYFKFGDEVTVTGSKTEFHKRPVVLASQIEKDHQTLRLRDKSGTPLWGEAGKK